MVYLYRKWVDEQLLDETIDYVQQLMEEECDQYFERIKTVAIKVEYDIVTFTVLSRA